MSNQWVYLSIFIVIAVVSKGVIYYKKSKRK